MERHLDRIIFIGMRRSWVYMMANRWKNVLYIGVTSKLMQRVIDHKTKRYPGSFTARYNCDMLVWYQEFNDIRAAITKEKQLKNWKREWKERLVNEMNPGWFDLSLEWDLTIERAAEAGTE
jgi:putative endonuclease